MDQHTLVSLADRLASIAGARAIVLGGSRASGRAHPDSDTDLALYYREADALDIEGVRAVAHELAPSPLVTELYGWGRWVNGGAWIQTDSGKIDFIYRNLDQVERVIEAGHRGEVDHDFDQQPPFGFRSVIYFAETRICVPLRDDFGEIARLKSRVAVYPEKLRQRIAGDSLWNAEFTLMHARTYADRDDMVSLAGTLTRVGHYLVQALFAWNREYFLNDKHSARMVDSFPLHPECFSERLSAILGHCAAADAVDQLSTLWRESTALTGGWYQPKFPA